jgi:uncharacterized protein
MPDQLIRSFTPDLEIRAAGKGGDGRTIEGIAVPYGVRQRIDHTLVESFARGAFNHQLRAAHRVFLSRGHLALNGKLIGKAVEMRDDAAGLWGAWRVSATAVGDETLTLVADGVLDELSIGFRERAGGNRTLYDGTIERVKADLVEVSVVEQGAYGRGALISGVREHAGRTCNACGGAVAFVTEEQPTKVVAARNLAQSRQLLAKLPPLPA